MTLRISRVLPLSGVPARYEVFRGADPRTLLPIDVVPFPGANRDAAANAFFYDDPGGDAALYYRVAAYDAANVLLDDSGPFAFSPAVAASVPTRVKVDHDYGAADDFRYVAASGAGVAGAKVRVYAAPDFDAGRTDLAAAVTETDDDGRWAAPVFLEPGHTYVLHFSKENAYGPDVVRVVV
jgi:hypothetical protein